MSSAKVRAVQFFSVDSSSAESFNPAAPERRLQNLGLDRYTKQEINKDPDLMDMQKRSQRSLVGILALTPVPATVSRGRGHVLPVRWVLVGFV